MENKMTTPRVYTVWDASNRLAPEDKVILLSDHKEVVREIVEHDEKTNAVNLKLQAQLKLALKQRDDASKSVTCSETTREKWIAECDADLAAILQEAK